MCCFSNLCPWSQHLLYVCLVAVTSGVSTIRSTAGEVPKVNVFRAGEDGYHTYRIPAIVRAKNGDLLAFAEGRKNGPADHGDIDIVLKRSSDGGKTWGPMQLVQDEWDEPTGEGVDRQSDAHCRFAGSAAPGPDLAAYSRGATRGCLLRTSDDHGETWAERRDISATALHKRWDWCAAGPVHGIQLTRGKHAGRLIAPCDHQSVNGRTAHGDRTSCTATITGRHGSVGPRIRMRRATRFIRMSALRLSWWMGGCM